VTPPLRVYGASLSYYTGKLEAYLRYKEIPYQRIAMGLSARRRIRRLTGADQMPALELPDGRFLTDTTPIIDWLEARHPDPPVIPRDPLQAFASRLLEDYAEEWLCCRCRASPCAR
jgi:glutathione S-transferase